MITSTFTRSAAAIVVLALLVGVVAGAAALRRAATSDPASDARASTTLVASIRAEPRSFNRYTARDLSTAVLTYLMHDALVRVNRATNQLEPDLAERWELLPDGRTYHLFLRPDVRFSDGAPFSSADVVFSFKAIYDEAVGSVLADTLKVRGRPLTVAADGPLGVTIQFPSAFGPGLRMLDGVPIYPRHRLVAARRRQVSFGVGTGDGARRSCRPRTVRAAPLRAGRRLTFDRNPR